MQACADAITSKSSARSLVKLGRSSRQFDTVKSQSSKVVTDYRFCRIVRCDKLTDALPLMLTYQLTLEASANYG